MRPSAMIKTFTDKYPLVGPVFWAVSIQYYIIQVVVAMAWTTHFSLLRNPISDLGNTTCGVYAGRYVCSPQHGLMNASFITLGITMMLGSALVYQEFKKSSWSRLGFSFMALAGAGTILVGLFPENSVTSLHALGAILPFLIGNLGLVLLSLVLAMPKPLRIYTLLSGGISLLALILFLTHTYLGIGEGGMERIVAYPQTLWMIIFGIYISSSHMAKRSRVGRKK